MSKSHTLEKKKRVKTGAWKGKERIKSTVNEGGFQSGEGGKAKRTYLGKVGENMSELMNAKALQEDLGSRVFTPSLATPEIGKEIERQRARS